MLAGLGVACCLLPLPPSAAADSGYAVAIDGRDSGMTVQVRAEGPRMLMTRADAARLGLIDAAAGNGKDMLDLRSIPGLRFQLEPKTRRLDLYRGAAANGNGNGAAGAGRPVIIDVAVNGQLVQRQVRALRDNGLFLFDPADAAGWRITEGTLAEARHRGRRMLAAGSGTGVPARLDRQQQVVDLQIAPGARAGREIRATGNVRPSPAATPSTGGFLNYDAYVETSRTGTFASQFLEGGIFTPLGVLLTTVLGQESEDHRRVVRLETTFVHDDPVSRRTLRLGDAISVPGDWSRPVRFGGVQIGRNFALDPSFVPYPLPAFTGQAGVPSTLDVFVNDALRFRSRVDDGPFTVSQIPTVMGGGTARVVVRDLLGREQVLSLPFYVSSRLLKEGLDAWSVEAGFLRRRFQQRSFSYGEFLSSATYRLGLTDALTVEGHGEAGVGRQALGGSVVALWPQVGEFNLSLAAARDDDRTGALVGVGFSRVFPGFGFSIRHTERSPGFRDLGVDPRLQVRSETQTTASLPLGRRGVLSGTVARQSLADDEEILVGSLNYSVQLYDRVQLSLFALHTENGRSSTTVGFNLAMSLGPRETVQAGMRHGRDGGTVFADYTRSPPLAGGFGARATVERGLRDRAEAAVEWDGSVGRLSVGAGVYEGRAAARASASGAVVLADGGLFFSRRIDDGFAVVTVPDQPNVRVYQENRLVGRTDDEGQFLVTRLRSYDANRIGIDVADLPIRATLARDRVEVAPAYRSGAIVRFPVGGLDTVLVRLRRDGKMVPPGARVVNDATGEAARVGRDGEAMLTVPDPASRYTLHDGNGGCGFQVPPFDRQQQAMPRLTIEVCQ